MFRMFSSERQQVELICDNTLMDAIIDRFGKEVTTYAYDMKSFRAVVDIAVNHVFYSWVFGFMGKVKINAATRHKRQVPRYGKKRLRGSQLLMLRNSF